MQQTAAIEAPIPTPTPAHAAIADEEEGPSVTRRARRRTAAALRARGSLALAPSLLLGLLRLNMGARLPIFGQTCNHFCPKRTQKRLDFWASGLREALG